MENKTEFDHTMSLNIKQGSSLLDDDEELTSFFQHEEEISDTDEDSDEYYEDEKIISEKENEEDTNEEREEVYSEKDQNNYTIDIQQPDHQKENEVDVHQKDDALLSSSDPKMNMLSNFLKKTTTQEEKTISYEEEEQHVSPIISDTGASLEPEEPVVIHPTGISEENHNTFSDDDYEFFSTYLEGDEFKHVSLDAITTYEQDADDELEDERTEDDDVFKPTIPIEEQFMIQEEMAVINSKNITLSKDIPPPSFAGVLAEDKSSPTFPQQKYSFTSADNEEDSLICNPSNTAESSPLPGLIEEAGEAASKISNDDKLNKMAFAIKVKMLKQETKGLYCNSLVDILFGEDDDNLKMPPLEMRQKLKKAIDIELTVKRFMDYKAVVDINTAELFMKDKNTLEDICRQQIMSNPLLSSLDYDNSSNESKISENSVETPQVALYQKLTDILNDSSNPATRMTNKISFLKNMLAFKIGNMCNMSKILSLISFIIKQAINTIGGDAAAKRVLLYYADAEDPSLSGAGIGLLFGTILGGINSAIIRSCASVARLAMTMGVPVVMLNWPQEFKASKDYDSLLRESILRFKNDTYVSLSFILDSVFDVEENEKKETISNTAVSIMTDKEKAEKIRDFNNDRDFFGILFEECGYSKKQRTLEMPARLLYQSASDVIEHKNKITDDILSVFVEYLEENKILLSKILNKLLSTASLKATMYYINSSSVKKIKKKTQKGKGIVEKMGNVSRGKFRSMMPIIAAPQKITSAKPSKYISRRKSNDSNTDSDINSHLIIDDYQKAAFKQWVDAQ